MKKLLITLVLVISFLTLPMFCHACTTEEKLYYKQAALNVKTTYNLIEESGVYFEVKVLNLVNGMYTTETFSNRSYWYNNTNETPIGYFKAGSRIDINIYACDTLMRKIAVTLPEYNQYSGSKLCEGLEDYELCQVWTRQSLPYDEFEKRMIEYRKSLIVTSEDPIAEKVSNKLKEIVEKVLQFILDNDVIIYGIIAIGGSVGIILVKNNDRKYIKIKI